MKTFKTLELSRVSKRKDHKTKIREKRMVLDFSTATVKAKIQWRNSLENLKKKFYPIKMINQMKGI